MTTFLLSSWCIVQKSHLPCCCSSSSRHWTTETVPDNWKRALVTPIFKKEVRSKPENYRLVSLTAICSKVAEHIIVSQTMRHLDFQNILVDCQHGFHRNRSCETHLLITTHDLATILNRHSQADVAELDMDMGLGRGEGAGADGRVQTGRGGSWDPHHQKFINQLVMVQQRAAWFVKNTPYRSTDNPTFVTAMVEDLWWDSLQNMRPHSRLTMFYRVTTGLVGIPPQYHPEPQPQPNSMKRHPKQFQHHQPEVNTYAYAFLPGTINDLNALSLDVVAAESLDPFKQQLNPHRQWT